MKENIIELISKEKIFPILRSSDYQTTLDRANSLIDGGIKVLEISIENPSIFKAIAEISKKAVVCAGGIITSIQANAAIECGAKIISSPIFQMNLVKISKDKHVPIIATASTANEAYNAWKARIPLVKIYPVTPLGGTLYLHDLLRPMPFLKVIPLGNVKLSEVKNYIDMGATAVGVGRDLYDGYSYNEITARAKNILKELKD